MPEQKNAAKGKSKKNGVRKNGVVKEMCRSVRNASIGTQYKTVRAKEKQRFPISVVIGAVITTVLFMFIIFSFMQISQIQADIADMKSTMRALEKEERKLSMELEGKYSSKIETLAADIGLSGESRVTYYLYDDKSIEVTEVIDPEDEEESSNTLMSAVSRSFRKFIEFME